jgi:hypothetical protein
MPHVEKHLLYNHPVVPLIAAGLTREGVRCREPYPAFLEAAIAGGHLFNKNDRHFSAEGRALFAKFVTDTKWREPPSTITSSPIEHFRQIGLSIIRSTIDRTARSQFDIVNAIYLGVRAFAERGLCRRCR